MAAYAQTPSALTWFRVNHLINGLHNQISCKNCLYADNSYGMIHSCIYHNTHMHGVGMPTHVHISITINLQYCSNGQSHIHMSTFCGSHLYVHLTT